MSCRSAALAVSVAGAVLAFTPYAFAQATKPPAPKPPAAPPKAAPAKPAPAAKPPAPAAKPAAPALPPPPPPPADATIVSSYTTGDKTATSTVSIKAARQRIDYGNDLATVIQCDAGQTIQLNTKTNTYLAAPFEDPTAPLPPAPPNTKGGQITYTTTVTDTGEKKEMFGYPARRMLTVVAKSSSATACDKKAERIETDGWYIDLPPALTCMGAPQLSARIQEDPKNSSCRDEVHFERGGTLQVGYPVSYTMTATGGTDKPTVTTFDVSSITMATLPAASFALPDGYLEVKTTVQLMAGHRPGEIVAKKPGVVRIGVAPIANKTDQSFSADVLSQALGETLSDSDLDIVALTGATPADRIADARAKDCDYVLENTVTELKKPTGGVLGKLNGASSGAGDLAARVDYTLAVPGQPKPTISNSERSGTSTLQSAVGAAKHVAIFVAPYVLSQYRFMSTFSAMNGSASPLALGQTSDPVLGTVVKLLNHVPSKAPESYSTGEAAIAAAMEKETQTIFSEMQKRKK
jgi:hypothetical protein